MVRIQELDGRSRFLADIWKRFATGEELDLRVNYGFASKREFRRSLKVQELNYGNIPVIEEKKGHDRAESCVQLKRRIICAKVGYARYVEDFSEVDHDNGKFLRIPPDQLKSFLKHPWTRSIYMKNYVSEFAKEYATEECLGIILNPGMVDKKIATDTEWLALRLSGMDASFVGQPAVVDESAMPCYLYPQVSARYL